MGVFYNDPSGGPYVAYILTSRLHPDKKTTPRVETITMPKLPTGATIARVGGGDAGAPQVSNNSQNQSYFSDNFSNSQAHVYKITFLTYSDLHTWLGS